MGVPYYTESIECPQKNRGDFIFASVYRGIFERALKQKVLKKRVHALH